MWNWIKFCVFQFDDLFHQNESLCEIPFLGWISPIQVYWLFGRWESREEIYWWITEIWTNVKLWENLTKQIFSDKQIIFGQRIHNAVHCTNPTTTTTTTSLSTLFIVNIQSLMRKFYYFHFSNSSEQKIILLYDYHWGNPKPWSYCAFIFQYLHKSEERSRLTLEIHLQGNI